MRYRCCITIILVACTAVTAFGRYKRPSSQQLAEAAKYPELIRELAEDASAEQAAEMLKDVIVKILDLDLPPEERGPRFYAVIWHLFDEMADDIEKLPAALGRAIAASPSASGDLRVVVSIQRTVIAVVRDVYLAAARQPASYHASLASVIHLDDGQHEAGATRAGNAAGAAFGNAYNLAMQSVAGAPSGGKRVPPTPPPPPVLLPGRGLLSPPPEAPRYPAQRLP